MTLPSVPRLCLAGTRPAISARLGVQNTGRPFFISLAWRCSTSLRAVSLTPPSLVAPSLMAPRCLGTSGPMCASSMSCGPFSTSVIRRSRGPQPAVSQVVAGYHDRVVLSAPWRSRSPCVLWTTPRHAPSRRRSGRPRALPCGREVESMLSVHRAERADALADALGELLARPLPDPFAAEVVAVPAKGVERWLAHRLAHRLGAERGGGVCAGMEFPSPSAVVAAAVCAATGIDQDTDPWRPERAVWPLLEVIDECADEPWCAALGRHVDRHRGRRHAVARHLAELFASYAAHRPDMLEAWRRGEVDLDPRAADLAWQPQLWRRLRERIGRPGPAERLVAAAAALRAEPERVALPERLSV